MRARPTPLTLAERFRAGQAALPEAGGPAPHRRAQAEQRARAGAASAAARQAPDRRETGAGSTASRRDRLRALRARAASSTWAARTCAGSAEPRADGAARRRGAAVEFGTRTLKEATSEAIRDWIANVEDTHYLIGSCVGPGAVPRDRARAPGGDRAARPRAVLEAEGRLPEVALACVGGALDAIGLFGCSSMISTVRLCGVEAGGGGQPRLRAARRAARDAVVGARRDGGTDRCWTRSRSPPGSTHPGVGPEHAYLRDTGRAQYVGHQRRGGAGRVQAARADGGHSPRARAGPCAGPRAELDEELVLVCLSGRGDKDLAEVTRR
jgi:tryptophan synthase beta subunit